MPNESLSGLLSGFWPEHELAKEMNVSTKTLKRWARNGRGPTRTKIGRKVFYARSSVLLWLENQQVSRGRQGRSR